MKRAILIVSLILSVISILILSAFLYYFALTADVKLDPDKLTLDTFRVQLYDSTDAELEGVENGRDVPLSELPDHLKSAFVAVEDKRFYSHNGLDYRRIGKALWKNISSFSFREGASTISQQLIKNTHLSGEKTVSRKLKEFKLTRVLERHYSKDEILGLYLNSIYFGHNAFGISNATQFYFGKEVSDLEPAESAMLAALVKSPNRYSPFRDAERCLARRNLVLKLMTEQGYLTNTELNAALKVALPSSPAETRAGNRYTDLVFDELSELFPDLEVGELSCLRVYTFLDQNLQKKLEKSEPECDFTMLVRDNKTGGVKAYHSSLPSPVKRLPASTIKPLLVYAPAIEENYLSPATPILDEPVNFAGYSPSNYGGKYSGYVSARQALSESINVPTVKILNSLGCDRACAYLERMGLPVAKEDRTLALALGGMREGYTLLSLADAYSTFANSGEYSASRTIRRVEDGTGKIIYSFRPEYRRVFSEETSYLVTDMLKTTATTGTAKRLKSLPFPIAAKTGTGANSEGNTDAYTFSYTRNDTVAVWLGNRDNSPISATGGGLPANYALEINRYLYQGGAPEEFPACEGVVSAHIDNEEYVTNHRILLSDPLAPPAVDFSELFKASALPTETSTRFSRPTISIPKISVVNGAVCIELCQTKYYDYVVKRDGDGKTVTVYRGNYREKVYDNSVRAGVEYRYTVTPCYRENTGESVELPAVRVPIKNQLPDDWWQ